MESATALAAYHSNPRFHGAEAGATHAACHFCGQGCHHLAPISVGPSEEGTEGGLGSVTRSGRRRGREEDKEEEEEKKSKLNESDNLQTFLPAAARHSP